MFPQKGSLDIQMEYLYIVCYIKVSKLDTENSLSFNPSTMGSVSKEYKRIKKKMSKVVVSFLNVNDLCF